MNNNHDSNIMKSIKMIEEEKKKEDNKKARLRMRKYRAKRSPEDLALDRQKSYFITKKNVNSYRTVT